MSIDPSNGLEAPALSDFETVTTPDPDARPLPSAASMNAAPVLGEVSWCLLLSFIERPGQGYSRQEESSSPCAQVLSIKLFSLVTHGFCSDYFQSHPMWDTVMHPVYLLEWANKIVRCVFTEKGGFSSLLLLHLPLSFTDTTSTWRQWMGGHMLPLNYSFTNLCLWDPRSLCGMCWMEDVESPDCC